MALAGLGAASCLGLTLRCLWAGDQAEQRRCIVAHNHVQQWHRDNIHLFAPPICNKIMHKDDLTVMCVVHEPAIPLPLLAAPRAHRLWRVLEGSSEGQIREKIITLTSARSSSFK